MNIGINKNGKISLVVIIFVYLYIAVVPRCKSNFIDLKNNYVEGLVLGDTEILANCTIFLDSETYTRPQIDGKFFFKNVKEGIYMLYVNHPYMEFNMFHVEVKKRITQNNDKIYLVQAYELLSPLEKTNLSVSKIVFISKGIYKFLTPQKSFQLINFLKSPIFLIFIFFLILLCILPKIQTMSEAVSNEESVNMVTYQSEFLNSIK
ncbi:conserved protein, unknown function [Hepatocystis sp. ex Piliocolobus tephrosceles]|nr:conserved protein, unknown function [Hepatocystis sp. ex Piliocolobus tephrosceles]